MAAARSGGDAADKIAAADQAFVDTANRYARDVVNHRIPACAYVIAACRRHLDDLERSKGDWPYRFDVAKAGRVCRFIELLPHTKGKWAKKDPANPRAHLITLAPWQVFILCVVFGWVRKADGFRRFRLAYIEVPRKNGKSALASGIGLYMFAADGEYGAEVYAGATTEKQALEVFRPARLICLQTPKLRKRFGIQVNAANLHVVANGSRFETVIGNPGDGASPSCAITDEYHEHDTSSQFDTMVTGMGAREQPLSLVITTAGFDIGGPCYELRSDLIKILEGVTPDEEKFGIVYTLDKDDDWARPGVLAKANPNIGVSVAADFLAARQREAVNSTRARGRFLTKHLNLWVNARSGFFDMKAWMAGARPGLTLDDFRGRPCRLGLDLASKVDIAALEILFPPLEEGGTWATFGFHYLPEATVDLPENERYQAWRDAGLLKVTDGNVTDYEVIEEDILDLADRFEVLDVAYDPHQATMLVNRLVKRGLPMIEYRPLVLTFSEPMKQLDALIRDGKLEHNGCPVMTWMMSNVVAKPDKKDNVYPDKEKPAKKIDGPVALISALGRAMAREEADDDFEYTGM